MNENLDELTEFTDGCNWKVLFLGWYFNNSVKQIQNVCPSIFVQS